MIEECFAHLHSTFHGVTLEHWVLGLAGIFSKVISALSRKGWKLGEVLHDIFLDEIGLLILQSATCSAVSYFRTANLDRLRVISLSFREGWRLVFFG